MEFPGDFIDGPMFKVKYPTQLSLTILKSNVPTADGSIHRFAGSVDLGSRTFIGEGDIANRLTFVYVAGVGYVYLRGKGKVRLPGGPVREFGAEPLY